MDSLSFDFITIRILLQIANLKNNNTVKVNKQLKKNKESQHLKKKKTIKAQKLILQVIEFNYYFYFSNVNLIQVLVSLSFYFLRQWPPFGPGNYIISIPVDVVGKPVVVVQDIVVLVVADVVAGWDMNPKPAGLLEMQSLLDLNN